MPTSLDQGTTAQVLEGNWVLGATNIVDWLDGTRLDAAFRFEVQSSDPLSVAEQQAYTSADGKDRVISIESEWVDGVFRSKGRGILRTGATRWRVGGVSDDRAILVLRIATVRDGQDGLFVLVRPDAVPTELRSTIATRAEEFGIGPEDFASLSWLDWTGPGVLPR